jgi:hypothetical protein
LNRAARIVVAWNDMINAFRIVIGIDHGYDRYAQLLEA